MRISVALSMRWTLGLMPLLLMGLDAWSAEAKGRTDSPEMAAVPGGWFIMGKGPGATLQKAEEEQLSLPVMLNAQGMGGGDHNGLGTVFEGIENGNGIIDLVEFGYLDCILHDSTRPQHLLVNKAWKHNVDKVREILSGLTGKAKEWWVTKAKSGIGTSGNVPLPDMTVYCIASYITIGEPLDYVEGWLGSIVYGAGKRYEITDPEFDLSATSVLRPDADPDKDWVSNKDEWDKLGGNWWFTALPWFIKLDAVEQYAQIALNPAYIGSRSENQGHPTSDNPVQILSPPPSDQESAQTRAEDEKNYLATLQVVAEGKRRMGERMNIPKYKKFEWPFAAAEEHAVWLDSYRIGRYEVTNAEFAEMLTDYDKKGKFTYSPKGSPHLNGYDIIHLADADCQITRDPETSKYLPKIQDGIPCDNYPVVEVTWYGAVAYANWLSEKHGFATCYDSNTLEPLIPFRDGYRLPTEAEWERAAGWVSDAPNGVRLPDGTKGVAWRFAVSSNEIVESRANFGKNPEKTGGTGLTLPQTTPIGVFTGSTGTQNCSPVGCADMSGNVWEWCHDWYTPRPKDTQHNPLGPPSGQFKITRGGAWNYPKEGCLVYSRGWEIPGHSSFNHGFRLARSTAQGSTKISHR